MDTDVKGLSWANKMPQWVTVLAVQAEDLRLIPRNHTKKPQAHCLQHLYSPSELLLGEGPREDGLEVLRPAYLEYKAWQR